MKKTTFIIKTLFIFLICAIVLIGISYLKVILTVPGELVLVEGEEYLYEFGSLFPISINADTGGIIKINGKALKVI